MLRGEFAKPYWATLQSFVAAERERYTVYPPHEQVFAALHLTPYADTRVVILGQDPYHGPRQAHGLCFSVRRGVAVPPSLANIHKELHTDLGLPIPDHGNLEAWARQGVLLLNTCLTVEDGQPASHARWGWEVLTDRLVALVATQARPVVFMLWGNHAQAKRHLIEQAAPDGRHRILQANHPSPLSALRGPSPFIGCGHFGQAQRWLQSQGVPHLDLSDSHTLQTLSQLGGYEVAP